MDKKTLRKEIRTKREALSEDFVKNASLSVCERFFEKCVSKTDESFLLYSDFRNEVMTKPMIDKLVNMGKNVFLPVVKGDDIIIAKYCGDALISGAYGILEPDTDCVADASAIDVFVVPGIAFDRNGGRIGFGKGYYDRLLAKAKNNSKKIALAFEMQIVSDAFSESFDVMMDAIVTEKTMYEVKK